MSKETKENPDYYLQVANCRGKQPVITDIKRAMIILRNLSSEINPGPGKEVLSKCENELLKLIIHN